MRLSPVNTCLVKKALIAWYFGGREGNHRIWQGTDTIRLTQGLQDMAQVYITWDNLTNKPICFWCLSSNKLCVVGPKVEEMENKVIATSSMGSHCNYYSFLFFSFFFFDIFYFFFLIHFQPFCDYNIFYVCNTFMILVIFMVWFSRNLRENREKGIEKKCKNKK